MSLLSNKIISIALASTLGCASLGIVSTTALSKNVKSQQPAQTVVNQKNTIKTQSTFNQKAFIKLVQPYVQTRNNKYIINADIYENPDITTSDINMLKEMLSKANEVIVKNNLKDISVTNGAVKQQYVGQGIAFAGETNVVFYWWGFYLYLNSMTTTIIADSTAGAAAAALGAATGGVLANPYVAGVVAAIISYGINNSPECQDGAVISWNYALGFQDMWAQ